MPSVYDQQTNLNARGKYAPSVNYYATVRQPNAVEPRLEKVKAEPIKIDFTTLANAMTDVKGMEIKQVMEEKELAARKELAELEDARLREFHRDEMGIKADELGLRQQELGLQAWKYGKDYEIDLAKLELDKEKAAKEKKSDLATRLFSQRLESENQKLLQKGESYRRQYNMNIRTAYAEAVNSIGSGDIGAINTLFYDRTAVGTSYKGLLDADKDISKDMAKEETNQYKTVYGESPWLQSMSPENARYTYNTITNQMRVYADTQKVLDTNSGATQEEIDAAIKQRQNAGIGMGKGVMFSKLFNFRTQIGKEALTNPGRALELLKRESAQTLINSGVDVNEAMAYVDVVASQLHLKDFISSYAKSKKLDATVAANIFNETITNQKLDMVDNIPGGAMLYAIPTQYVEAAIRSGNADTVKKVMDMYGNIEAYGRIRRGEYTPEQLASVMNLTGINNPAVANSTLDIMMMRKIQPGFIFADQMNFMADKAYIDILQKGGISNERDVDVMAYNGKIANWSSFAKKCETVGSKEGMQKCILAEEVTYMLGNQELIRATQDLANSRSIGGENKDVKYRYTSQGGFEFGFTGDNVDITADNYNKMKKVQDLINQQQVSPDAKREFLLRFKGLEGLEMYNGIGEFRTEPNILQKATSTITDIDRATLEASSKITPNVGEDSEELDKKIDEEISRLKD